MPKSAPRPCCKAGCGKLAYGRFCDEHKHIAQEEHDSRRGSAASRGYDARWQKLRNWYIQQNPLCVMCKRAGIITAASVVDHITPIRQAPELRLDASNLQSLCAKCHNSAKQRHEIAHYKSR